MTITKKEFSAVDAAPLVLYGKQDPNSETAYPFLMTSTGNFVSSDGFPMPVHDQRVIDESNPTSSTITYKLSGAPVAIKYIDVTAPSVTTITMTIL